MTEDQSEVLHALGQHAWILITAEDMNKHPFNQKKGKQIYEIGIERRCCPFCGRVEKVWNEKLSYRPKSIEVDFNRLTVKISRDIANERKEAL